MRALLEQIQATGLFTQIRTSAYAYPVLLWVHVIALIVWCGMMLVTDLRLFGVGRTTDSVGDVLERFRRPKRIAFLLAALSGILLFSAKAEEYAYNPFFWIKMELLTLLAATYMFLRRATLQDPRKRKMAAGLSILLWMGAIAAARGPATLKDIMHSMIDPSGDFLFQSVQSIADDAGVREVAPQTDSEWQDVRLHAQVLQRAPALLGAPGLRAARPRDRSKNPAIENEPAEIQQLLDTNRADFARRARRLSDAATTVIQAVDAKDKAALSRALNGIDQACELCHLRYWYPRDTRAVDAARASGILE